MNKIYSGNNKWFDADCLKYRKGSGGRQNSIDWVNSVGSIVEFECLGHHGFYTITEKIDSNKNGYKYLYVIYFDNDTQKEYVVDQQTLRKVNFAYILGIYSNNFLYNVGDIVNGQFLVLKREHKRLFPSDESCIKVYTCICLCDGYIFENTERNLKRQKKCEVCLGKVVIKGINDIATTRPEIVKFLKNKEDAFKYTGKSSKPIDFVCDICGKDFSIAPNSFCFSFPCECYSSDSYPNRLIQEVFNRLKIPYIRELRKCHFAWCEKYRYDLYFELENKAYIVEMDGWFHKDEQLKIDKLKDELAKENGVKVIRIDCNYDKTENRLSYIKDNLLYSELSLIIDLSNIDWNIINEKILNNNITKKVCDLRNQGYTNKKIAKILDVSTSIVDSHIKIGKNNNLLNEWAISNNLTKAMVVEIINLKSKEVQYCIGVCEFYKNVESYIGIKANNNLLKKNSVNGCIVLNGYEIKKFHIMTI